MMITHDIDEALFLADRLVMMTNGPKAKIGEILEIPFSRPRNRVQITEDPRYYELRNYALDFLFHRYAHHEDPAEEDSVPETNNKGKLKIAGIVGAVAVVAIAGFTLFQSFSGNNGQSPNNTEQISK
jgi:nitrate/nitrite transport system ATP-binding protein